MHHLPNSYTEIVIDPSGRAKCMWCRSKIAKGDCRFEDVTVGQGYDGKAIATFSFSFLCERESRDKRTNKNAIGRHLILALCTQYCIYWLKSFTVALDPSYALHFFLKGVQCDIERVQCANAPNYINQGQDMSCKIHVGCYRIPAKVPKTEAGRLAWLTSDVRGFKVLDAAKVRTLKFYSIYFYTL